MITDYADKLHLYGDLQEYADMVLAFIEKQKKENLPAGRYDLENGVFASVQSYTTRPLEGSQMESHKKYCDLQYLIEGKEKIYWASLRNLTVENDMTPESDSILYVAGPWQLCRMEKQNPLRHWHQTQPSIFLHSNLFQHSTMAPDYKQPQALR